MSLLGYETSIGIELDVGRWGGFVLLLGAAALFGVFAMMARRAAARETRSGGHRGWVYPLAMVICAMLSIFTVVIAFWHADVPLPNPKERSW